MTTVKHHLKNCITQDQVTRWQSIHKSIWPYVCSSSAIGTLWKWERFLQSWTARTEVEGEQSEQTEDKQLHETNCKSSLVQKKFSQNYRKQQFFVPLNHATNMSVGLQWHNTVVQYNFPMYSDFCLLHMWACEWQSLFDESTKPIWLNYFGFTCLHDQKAYTSLGTSCSNALIWIWDELKIHFHCLAKVLWTMQDEELDIVHSLIMSELSGRHKGVGYGRIWQSLLCLDCSLCQTLAHNSSL